MALTKWQNPTPPANPPANDMRKQVVPAKVVRAGNPRPRRGGKVGDFGDANNWPTPGEIATKDMQIQSVTRTGSCNMLIRQVREVGPSRRSPGSLGGTIGLRNGQGLCQSELVFHATAQIHLTHSSSTAASSDRSLEPVQPADCWIDMYV
ncbi:hypothetical protein JZ751_023182 [Albula glossodonta]|uniref:Uncharacterized protein n=1 Tax=Albula glossodonta TaxID=121402 RepID=A0A8T2PKZ2_9TELE|nr:hypothetical protein JZ751_023182 [Albula glossodonta]